MAKQNHKKKTKENLYIEREGPVEKIESDIDASVANMAEIVSGDSANVHAHFTFYFGLELLLVLAHGVVQPQLVRWNTRLGGTRRSETSADDKAPFGGGGLDSDWNSEGFAEFE